MAKTVAVIGIDPGELACVKTVLSLLRNPDPVISEMVRQSLAYLEKSAHGQAPSLGGDSVPERSARSY
jgi:hypothetical protein